MKNKLNKIKKRPMKASELKKHVSEVKFITYDELSNYNNINELFETTNYVIILIRHNENSGHYVCLINDPKYIEVFDSYGLDIQDHKNMVGGLTNNMLGQEAPLLNDLLNTSKKKIIYNKKSFQHPSDLTIATCGRHCLYRFKRHKYDNEDLKKYTKTMDEIQSKTNLTYDQIVSYMINNENDKFI
jgi:hypothetical protein